MSGNNYQRRLFSSAPRGDWGCGLLLMLALGGPHLALLLDALL